MKIVKRALLVCGIVGSLGVSGLAYAFPPGDWVYEQLVLCQYGGNSGACVNVDKFGGRYYISRYSDPANGFYESGACGSYAGFSGSEEWGICHYLPE